MRLYELIKRLQAYNPDLQVRVTQCFEGDGDFKIANVTCDYEPSQHHDPIVRIIFIDSKTNGIG